MTKNAIVQKGDKVLRTKAREVPIKEITSPKIKKIIERMGKALASTKDGVALAAPQIGVPLRIFIVDKNFLEARPETEKREKIERWSFINPKILKKSRQKKLVSEGCLSVKGIYGRIKRAEKVKIEAYDEEGRKFTYGASGLLAQIFQHEIEHLDGILFIDKAEELWKIET